jgi:hypothetical protein
MSTERIAFYIACVLAGFTLKLAFDGTVAQFVNLAHR